MKKQSYYILKLKECLSEKQRRRNDYSLRAFARDIEVHPSTLSQVLNGKRGLPVKSAHSVAEKLDLSPKERTLFIDSFFNSKSNLDEIKISELDERFILDESYYKVIAEWEHFAALELLELNGFKFNSKNVSKKLDVKVNRAELVISNLLKCGLLKRNRRGRYEKAHLDIKTTEDVSSKALRKSHRESLELGITKLDEVALEFRDFSSATFAIDPEKIGEAKTIIREFRQKMAALLRNGKKEEVYQLAIQFYPLSKMEK